MLLFTSVLGEKRYINYIPTCDALNKVSKLWKLYLIIFRWPISFSTWFFRKSLLCIIIYFQLVRFIGKYMWSFLWIHLLYCTLIDSLSILHMLSIKFIPQQQSEVPPRNYASLTPLRSIGFFLHFMQHIVFRGNKKDLAEFASLPDALCIFCVSREHTECFLMPETLWQLFRRAGGEFAESSRQSEGKNLPLRSNGSSIGLLRVPRVLPPPFAIWNRAHTLLAQEGNEGRDRYRVWRWHRKFREAYLHFNKRYY